MFCCKSGGSFSPTHDLDSVMNKRPGSKRVIDTQPKTEPSEINSTRKSEEENKDTENDEENNHNGLVITINNDEEEEVDVARKGRQGFRATQVNHNLTDIPSHPKPKFVEETLRCAIKNNQFLHDLIPDEIIDKVVSAMGPRDVRPGETIIRQGEVGDKFYVNEQGSYQVLVNNQVVSNFDTSIVFGELAVLYNQKRAATVLAKSSGVIWSIDGTVYKALMIIEAKYQQEQLLKFLRGVEALSNCPPAQLSMISKLLKTQFYPANVEIIKEGDVGDRFFIIKAGNVTIKKKDTTVANLHEGQYFGEMALLKDDVRQATCIADAPGVTCLELTRQEFNVYLGDFEEFTQKRTTPKEKPPTQHVSRAVSISVMVVSPEDLLPIATIGEGGFGRVVLVKDKNSGKHYALKKLAKVDNNSEEQRKHVKNEKLIHKACDSKFIVKLYKTYSDNRYLYFLMEACMGGDLFRKMQNEKTRCFAEKDAQFIAACILEALGYMHEKNYIYRDLKPENMLIDEKGYVKLADFGFAKELPVGTSAFTFAGTPEYVAPEVIYSVGHDKAVDYWAFGIFVFELLAGKTPFKSNDPSYMVTYSLILKGIDNIQFPKLITKNAGNLVKKLCRLTPHERLGCQRGKVDDIRNHKWFQSFNWQALRDGSFKSSLNQNYDPSNPWDTSNFDCFDDEYPEPKVDNSKWDDFDCEV